MVAGGEEVLAKYILYELYSHTAMRPYNHTDIQKGHCSNTTSSTHSKSRKSYICAQRHWTWLSV